MDKDRFRQDLGGLVEYYQEIARRLGLLPADGTIESIGPRIVET
jgi:phosphoribosylaminoimidazole-succinocarboxamide synthase